MNFLIDCNPFALGFNKLAEASNLFSDLSGYFAQLLLKGVSPPVERLLFAIGVVSITYQITKKAYDRLRLYRWAPRHFLNRKRLSGLSLRQRYGDCFVVITGCTQGIGLALFRQLAMMGFGLVLVARNEDKLKRRISQIKILVPNLKYRTIIADLGKREQYYMVAKKISLLMQQIDIGIVINNAGITGDHGPFLTRPVHMITDILETNFMSMYAINRQILPKLSARKHRSALINFSSCVAVYPSHFLTSYSASKEIVDHYTRAMAMQNRQKIDILSVRPFGVVTPMLKMYKSSYTISPDECAVCVLSQLGQTDTTFTGFRHKLLGAMYQTYSDRQIFDDYHETWLQLIRRRKEGQ